MTIEQRLARLESEVRRWRRAGACIAVVCVVAIAGWVAVGTMKPRAALAADAQAVPTADEIRAKKLVIVNGDGRNAIELGTMKEGAFITLDNGDKQWCILSGSNLIFSNDKTELLNVGTTDAPLRSGNLTVFNALGKVAATVQSSKKNEGFIAVADTTGKLVKGLAP